MAQRGEIYPDFQPSSLISIAQVEHFRQEEIQAAKEAYDFARKAYEEIAAKCIAE